ncbi:MAG: hypothetical protein R2704_04720 [Microthrixaceae bacterium]
MSSATIPATNGTLTVQVATSLSDVNRSIAVVRLALGTLVPTLVLAVAMGSWVMTRRSLEPVAVLRRRVGRSPRGPWTNACRCRRLTTRCRTWPSR